LWSSLVQACLLCIAILSSLLSSEYARSEVIGLNGLPDPGSGEQTRMLLDVLLTAVAFVVPAGVLVVQVSTPRKAVLWMWGRHGATPESGASGGLVDPRAVDTPSVLRSQSRR
jgi:hypothetical protein